MKQLFEDFKNVVQNGSVHFMCAAFSIVLLMHLFEIIMMGYREVAESSFGYMLKVNIILLSNLSYEWSIILVGLVIVFYVAMLMIPLLLSIVIGLKLSNWIDINFENNVFLEKFEDGKLNKI